MPSLRFVGQFFCGESITILKYNIFFIIKQIIGKCRLGVKPEGSIVCLEDTQLFLVLGH